MIEVHGFKEQWRELGAGVLGVVGRVGAGGWYIQGPELKSFESRLAASWGVPCAVGVGNGLDAIEIALRSLGLAPGDKVLTTPLSAFATTPAIVRCSCATTGRARPASTTKSG